MRYLSKFIRRIRREIITINDTKPTSSQISHSFSCCLRSSMLLSSEEACGTWSEHPRLPWEELVRTPSPERQSRPNEPRLKLSGLFRSLAAMLALCGTTHDHVRIVVNSSSCLNSRNQKPFKRILKSKRTNFQTCHGYVWVKKKKLKFDCILRIIL